MTYFILLVGNDVVTREGEVANPSRDDRYSENALQRVGLQLGEEVIHASAHTEDDEFSY